jgi:hypothetical protein
MEKTCRDLSTSVEMPPNIATQLPRRIDGEDIALALRGVIERDFLSLRRPFWRGVVAGEIR